MTAKDTTHCANMHKENMLLHTHTQKNVLQETPIILYSKQSEIKKKRKKSINKEKRFVLSE